MFLRDVLDLDRYPLDRPDSEEYRRLVDLGRTAMAREGMFNLHGFVRPAAILRAAREIQPLCDREAFTHRRRHNVYFREHVEDLPADHSALRQFETVNHTLCDDQLQGTLIHAIYEFAALPSFLAHVLNKPRLFLMADPLARANVLEYRPGEALNWHFDRSKFTVTLLLQAAEAGGEFEFRSGLRTDSDPNYEGVARTLRGADPEIRVNPLSAGTLNVFAGKNTLHRVSPVRGRQNRIVAVYSYYERPDVMFSAEERIGFYGRAA